MIQPVKLLVGLFSLAASAATIVGVLASLGGPQAPTGAEADTVVVADDSRTSTSSAPTSEPPTSPPSSPPTSVDPVFNGVDGTLIVTWSKDVRYSATVTMRGRSGEAVVSFADIDGATTHVSEELTLAEADDGWYYQGTGPTNPDGTLSDFYQPDTFRLVSVGERKWSIDAVCDPDGCQPADAVTAS
jgi:hypothetical protein